MLSLRSAGRWTAAALFAVGGMTYGADSIEATHEPPRSGCWGDQITHRPSGFQLSSFWLEVDFWPQPMEPHISKDGNGACVTTGAKYFEGQTYIPEGGSRLFYFFSRDNIEVIVKVLDGCAINGHYWVFATGLTDIPWRLRVKHESLHLRKKQWSIDPGESMLKKSRYEDHAHNPWSPDLYQDRETGLLYNRLSTREIPRTDGHGGAFSWNDHADPTYQVASQVADTKAFKCDR